MKTLKLKAKHYKDLSQLLIDAGAANLEKGIAFPNDVYCSKEDMKKMTSEITKLFKKEFSWSTTKKIKTSVAMHMLNLSPNESLADAVRPGYVLVDDESIAAQLSDK